MKTKKFLKYSFIFLLIMIGVIIPFNSDFSYTPVLAAPCPSGEYEGTGENYEKCISGMTGLPTGNIPQADQTPTPNTTGTTNGEEVKGKATEVDCWAWDFFADPINCSLPKVANAMLYITS